MVVTIWVSGADEAFAAWCSETFPEASVWMTDGPERVDLSDGTTVGADTLRLVYREGW